MILEDSSSIVYNISPLHDNQWRHTLWNHHQVRLVWYVRTPKLINYSNLRSLLVVEITSLHKLFGNSTLSNMHLTLLKMVSFTRYARKFCWHVLARYLCLLINYFWKNLLNCSKTNSMPLSILNTFSLISNWFTIRVYHLLKLSNVSLIFLKIYNSYILNTLSIINAPCKKI